ncbi:MAG: IPExxxVDY family protein [Flavobacterium sp.]|uniref:IPExxxVDY family protein n=1 Tax=Flavobacterium sp. TaxID=239 RepID=UPI0022BCAA5E|nr:IPExxxVDY family protein [Flavobacterium sp.]MCZ8198280.1 IPExxxVDY family protein [Flavobacterium sp.]
MAIHKLIIDDCEEANYELLAIHTSLEDYRLAYFVNQKLPVLFSKSEKQIQVISKIGKINFSKYSYSNTEKEEYWDLIQNKNEIIIQKKLATQNLFGNEEETTTTYLVPEFKKVDYFIKIENSEIDIESILTKINTIERISTVYAVDLAKIKSKNNLIF